jgi:hypothetical protein
MLRVGYCITYSKGTIPFRICYCLTEVLYDYSNHVKASVLWRHGKGDFIGFDWDPYKMSVTNHPSSLIEKYRNSSTYIRTGVVRTMAVVHCTSYYQPLPQENNKAIGRKSSYRRQTPPPPHTQHTRPTVANQRPKSCMTVVTSDHVKASLQWRHVWRDFRRGSY